MDKDNTLVLVTPDDIAFLEGELGQTRRPFALHELTGRWPSARRPASGPKWSRSTTPAPSTPSGDSIYKEYDEPLTVGSRVQEHFQGSVVLKVVRKTVDKPLGCDMLEVDYTGGGIFRKYVDYMAKTKTQVLLPSNCGLQSRRPGSWAPRPTRG